MKRIISLAMVGLALSCTVNDASTSYKSNQLGNFADNMVGDIIISPVTALLDCETRGDTILKSGFEVTQNGIYLKLLSAVDSTWSAANAVSTDLLSFSATVKMLPDNPEGFHRWRCVGSGTYYEDQTFKADLETASSNVMEWVDERSSTTFTRKLTLTGKFTITTMLRTNDKVLDRCTVAYDKSPVGNSSREYNASLGN